MSVLRVDSGLRGFLCSSEAECQTATPPQLTTTVCVGSGSGVCFVSRLCGVTQASPEETHLGAAVRVRVSGRVWGEEGTATVSPPPAALRRARSPSTSCPP